MNPVAFDLRSLHWPDSLPWQRRPPLASAAPPKSAPVRPSCRLLLEGGGAREGPCDILALSSEGVTISLQEGRVIRRGQHGQLLIGPAGGSHYTLPVAVRMVKPSMNAAVVELTFSTSERWTYIPA